MSADSLRTTAFLFFCKLPALLMELWLPSEALVRHRFQQVQLHLQGLGSRDSLSVYQTPVVSKTLGSDVLLSTVNYLISSLATSSSISPPRCHRPRPSCHRQNHHVLQDFHPNLFPRELPLNNFLLSLHCHRQIALLHVHELDGFLQFAVSHVGI